MKKPIIGLTTMYELRDENDRIILNHSYLDTIRQFGGTPLILPTEGKAEDLKALVELCDGLVLTGGADVHPSRYGEQIRYENVSTNPTQDAGEWLICDFALAQNLPILGICRGIQTMNVYFGGTLYQDIPSQIDTTVQHSMALPKHRTEHECIVVPGTPLHQLVGTDVFQVNSHHHQSIKDLAPGFEVMGRCGDGVIEAIYHPSKPFLWGVQWHPERIWDIESSSAQVFEAFMQAV